MLCPGQEAISHEIVAKYHILRQMSDFGPISAVQHVVSRHSLQVESWFFDSSPPANHMDRTNTSFPGHEGVSFEINAKYLKF